MSLQGKIAVVTGGSQGIGASVCERLAADGATVCVVASSSIAKAEAVASRIGAAGGHAIAATADVTSAASLQAMVDGVVERAGRIDILVNSAGVFYPTLAGEASEADVARMLDTNVKGVFLAISAVAPVMRAQRHGKIVNLSSVAGFMGLKGYSVYCATKAGIMLMTRALALELGPHGINVNAIAPGNTATPMNENIRTDPAMAGYLEAMTEKTPSGRTYSTPEEMAGLVAFLVSDASRAMHGSTVLIDEGFSAGL